MPAGSRSSLTTSSQINQEEVVLMESGGREGPETPPRPSIGCLRHISPEKKKKAHQRSEIVCLPLSRSPLSFPGDVRDELKQA